MIGLCTDSNSQIPPWLAQRYAVEVVPLTVTIDGEAFLEGAELDAEGFWARLGSAPGSVSTAAPSAGQVAAAYTALVARGATRILSVHVSAEVSSTLSSVGLAASGAAVPVRVVDSATASFGVTCAVWEAAEALRRGADLEEAARIARATGASTGNVFVLHGLDLARRGGRLGPRPGGSGGSGEMAVLSMIGATMRQLARVSGAEDAISAMAGHILGAHAGRLRVAIGTADPATEVLGAALEERLRRAPGAEGAAGIELLRYRIGPSVGAHTGPGTVGAYFYPLH